MGIAPILLSRVGAFLFPLPSLGLPSTRPPFDFTLGNINELLVMFSRNPFN